jgi:hypothetical protein
MKQPWSFVSAGRDFSGDPAQSEFVTKQQIFEKVKKRLGEMEKDHSPKNPAPS